MRAEHRAEGVEAIDPFRDLACRREGSDEVAKELEVDMTILMIVNHVREEDCKGGPAGTRSVPHGYPALKMIASWFRRTEDSRESPCEMSAPCRKT